jgi:hypothetical protein
MRFSVGSRAVGVRQLCFRASAVQAVRAVDSSKGRTMTRGFLPNTDGALLRFVLHFSEKVSAGPGVYGLTSLQATQFAASCQAYADRFRVNSNLNARSRITVQEKNAAKQTLKEEARRLVSIVRGQPQLSDAQLTELGLDVRKRTQTPIAAPTSAPTLRVRIEDGGRVLLQVNDSQVSGRRKPADVHGATFFMYVGEDAPGGPEAFRFLRSAGKTTIRTQLPDDLAPGTRVYFTAIWFNAKGDHGPATTPISIQVPFSSVPRVHERLRDAA